MKMSTRRKSLLVLLVIVLGYFIGTSLSFTQVRFPTRPVSMWVGFSAGGITDVVIRALAAATEKHLGQRIAVINKPGGGGTLSVSLLAKEKPDGYTIGGNPDAPFTRGPHLMDVNYDPLRDLTYIILVGKWQSVFVVRADSPFKKWEDLVDWAKKNPGQLIHGHPGIGTNNQLAMVKVAMKEKFTYKSVPFNGDAPLLSALLGGHVMLASTSAPAWRSQIEAKTVRVLLVFDKEGLEFAPDAPTCDKMGYDIETTSSVIVFAPKGIPDPIRGVLEKAFADGMKEEAFKTASKTNGLLLTEPLTGKALLDYVRKNYLSYEQLIKEAGLYKSDNK